VMIDDLVTKGVSEPYRMFTSRAEYRLSLRADNADERLTLIGIATGLVGPERQRAFEKRKEVLSHARELVSRLSLSSAEAAKQGLKINQDGRRRTALEFIAHPEIGFEQVKAIWPELAALPRFAIEALEADALYAGYLQRQEADIVALRKDEGFRLSADLDYNSVPSLSAEIRQKLQRVKPANIGQASRIDGMTPAALAQLLGFMRRRERLRESA